MAYHLNLSLEDCRCVRHVNGFGMYPLIFVVDYKPSTDSMVSFSTVCVHCCFCFLYVYWLSVEAVSVYFSISVIYHRVTAIIICFSYNSV